LPSQTRYAMKATGSDNCKPEGSDIKRKGRVQSESERLRRRQDAEGSQDLYFKQFQLSKVKDGDLVLQSGRDRMLGGG